ncbi:hypothetical protein [Aegicerativicinus sediminis]|uniref:hypothetical protein n=1 Tax=Aegicerativicinus sediminis TaxID=2893202 RepID=UPI001E421AB0|nr:hypothetical protein [Aegicerativicinus sediminis]
MRFLTGLLCILFLSVNSTVSVRNVVANSAISEIDKIFEGKKIQIEVRYYGGINPSLIGKSILTITSISNSKFNLNFSKFRGGNYKGEFSQTEKNTLKCHFKDLLLAHHQNRIIMGNCTNFDKCFVLIGNGKKLEIKPNIFSQKQENLEVWLQQKFS